jgi:hypothetical protein
VQYLKISCKTLSFSFCGIQIAYEVIGANLVLACGKILPKLSIEKKSLGDTVQYLFKISCKTLSFSFVVSKLHMK